VVYGFLSDHSSFIQGTLYDTIIDTNVDFLSEFTVMDTYNQKHDISIIEKARSLVARSNAIINQSEMGCPRVLGLSSI
jgi:hypothetical protein